MKFYLRNFLNIEIIWTIVIGLLFVSPVHLFPRPRAKPLKMPNQYIKTLAIDMRTPASLETLNSKAVNVNAKKIIGKPVFNVNDNLNYRSARYLESKPSSTNRPKNSGKSSRQSNIPFMAVPSNWVATFEPSNAVILTNKVPVRIWAIGSVAKFPSFIEKIVQRIQSYYSTYKYHDLSRPASQSVINTQYHQLDPENTGTNDSTDEIDSLDGFGSIETETVDTETIDNDPIDDYSTELDTETPFPDYFDTTTDLNYFDLDTSTETNIEIS